MAMTLEQILERMEKAPGYSPEREKWIAGIRAHLTQPAQAVDVGADFNAMNHALCDFAMRWEIDGDYMRCRKCKRAQITNYASHDFPHSVDCKAAGKVEAKPWETFAHLLSPLTRALAGEKAEGWIPTDDDVRAWKGRNDVTLSLYDCRTAIEDARMMHHFDVSPTPPTDGEE